MEFVVFLARWSHIVLGTIWVGLGVTMAFIVHPAANYVDDGYKYLHALYKNTMFNRIMPVAAIVTTVAGLFLYMPQDGISQLVSQIGGAGHAVLGIGALAGLAAFGHGIGVGRLAGKFGDMDLSDVDEAKAMSDRLARNARISAILVVVAVVFMASARYVGTTF